MHLQQKALVYQELDLSFSDLYFYESSGHPVPCVNLCVWINKKALGVINLFSQLGMVDESYAISTRQHKIIDGVPSAMNIHVHLLNIS